jgi:hypothetical protein
MEELQYYFREKDETNQQLKYQVKHLSEKIRTSKKVCGWFVDLWCLTPHLYLCKHIPSWGHRGRDRWIYEPR